jgi:hypothetical protein
MTAGAAIVAATTPPKVQGQSVPGCLVSGGGAARTLSPLPLALVARRPLRFETGIGLWILGTSGGNDRNLVATIVPP